MAKKLSSEAVEMIGSGVGVAGSLIDNSMNQYYAQQNMRLQAELNKQQYDHEFYREASYNNPQAERARLEAAGLNPALMYEHGAGGSSVNASIGQTGLSHLPASDISGSLIAGAESMARIRNLDANTNKTKTETDYLQAVSQTRLEFEKSQALREKYGAVMDEIEKNFKEAKSQAELDEARARLNKINSDIANDKTLTANDVKRADAYVKSVSDLGAEIESKIALNKAKTTTESTIQERNEWEAARDRALNYWDNELNPAKRDNIIASTNNLDSLTGLNNKNAEYVKAYVILRAIATGNDVIKTISSESRLWARYFLDKTNSEEKSMLNKLFEVAGDDVSYKDIFNLLSSIGNFAK